MRKTNTKPSAIKPLVLEDFKLDPRLVVIEAGAGSGKTYNLVRIVSKMSKEGRDISRVLLVTFTNAAALEMRQRMRDLLEKELEEALTKKPDGGSSQQLAAIQQLAAMQITTIHSFCHRAYAEYGPIAGFPTIEGTPKDSSQLAAEIGEDFWRKKSREPHPPEVSLKEIIKATELLLGENTAQGKGVVISQKLESSGLRDFIKKRVAELQAAGGLLTFDTVIQNLLDALRDKTRGTVLREAIRNDFDACLIDESQDTDAKQWEVFEQIFSNREDDAAAKLLVMVGDRKQSIYGFRGANVDNYKDVVAGADEKLGLNENNRSSKQLIELFNLIFADRGDKNRFFGKDDPFTKIQVPDRKDEDPRPAIKALLRNSPGRPLRILSQNGTEDIVNEVARMLLELQTSGTYDGETLKPEEVKFRDKIGKETAIGILTRTGSFARKVHLALVNRGIPAALATKSSIFTSPLAPRLHHLLQAVLTPEDGSIRRALFILQPPLFGQVGDLQSFMEANDSELAAWLRKIRATWIDDGFGRAWEELLSTYPRLNSSIKSSLRIELAKGPMGLRQLADLSHIGEILCIRARHEKFTPEALLHHLAQRITRSADMDDDAEEIEQIRAETANPQVIVRTIHGAKGLEYHGVILPEFGKINRIKAERGGLLRRGKQIALVSDSSDEMDVEEYAKQSNRDDANLLYVALTRAERKVCIMWSKSKEAEGIASGFPVVMENAGLGKDPAGFVAWLNKHSLIKDYEVELPADKSKLDELTKSETNILRKPTLIKLTPGEPRELPFERGSTSFTELAKSKAEKYGSDKKSHGQNPLKSSAKANQKDLETLPFLAFKGGKGPGVVMHSILEAVDFVDSAQAKPSPETEKVIYRLLRSSGICLLKDPAATEEALQQTTQLYLKMLPKWMSQPLSGESAIRLGAIRREDRSSEIRFSLRCDVDEASTKKIEALLQADADPTTSLAQNPVELSPDQVSGLLTGSIDVAFRHDGKFYIVDWKSNMLGPKPDDYRPEVMAAEIAAHKYHLQYTIYAAVFHMHMKSLVADWDYEKHFGGCHYLFMRAFGCGQTGFGDHSHRPKYATIQGLLAILGHPQSRT